MLSCCESLYTIPFFLLICNEITISFFSSEEPQQLTKPKKIIEEAGFVEIYVQSKDKSREFIQAWDPNKSDRAGDYVVSAYIEAV